MVNYELYGSCSDDGRVCPEHVGIVHTKAKVKTHFQNYPEPYCSAKVKWVLGNNCLMVATSLSEFMAKSKSI